ncbi:MAG: hypothetical protein JWP74_375 [Marmoricola sp.]|nr:hypothetical protein [Marmoricola sp.]
MAIYNLQLNFLFFVFVALFLVKLWAMVDAVLRPAQAFEAADKQTKTAWLWITGLALGAHVLLGSLTLELIGTVAAFVYLLDVRPALAALTRRR